MHGLMMDIPLTVPSIIDFAERNFPNVEIVSVTEDNPDHRYTYRDCARRVRKLANALTNSGIQPGDRIATLAWNDYRHLEMYYAISGIGAINHTINPRLFPEQIAYIINHAEDRFVFVDPLLLPILENLQDKLSTIEKVIVLTDSKHMPETRLNNVFCYEDYISGMSDEFFWSNLDEKGASSLCYTSGTTGNPKGVLYSHRSTVLHSYSISLPNTFGFSLRDTMLLIVPMFHVNGWGVPYAALMNGAKLILPGSKMGDEKILHKLMVEEGVTISAGVPTVWLSLLAYLEREGRTTPSLNRIIVGGAACPLSIIEEFADKHGVHVHHAWGMTELGVGTFNLLTPDMETLDEQQLNQINQKQGRELFGVEMKIVDEVGTDLPRDGKSPGSLKIRGPYVCNDYYRTDQDDNTFDSEGWLNTGDVATIDRYGFMQITDRAKDVIKSGGEWISSIDLENTAVGHPQVLEAAVIGVPHPKWTERPLLILVRKDKKLVKEEIIEWLKDKVPGWWLPEDVVFVESIPHTATGKIQKSELREQFKSYTSS